MLYLLDANVLIDANRDYYPIQRVPEFWDWLLEMGRNGSIKVPEEIYEEIVPPPSRQPDELAKWLKSHKDTMVLDEQVSQELIARAIEQGYAPDLTDEEIEKVGRDPFLIAYALADFRNRCVVTTERSRSSTSRANRHLPDVCDDLQVPCINTFELIRTLNFYTGWRAPLSPTPSLTLARR